MAESLLREMFLGELSADRLLPYPTLDGERAELLAVLREALGRYAADHVDARAIDKAHELPREVLDGLAELGLFGLVIPEEHGGLALDATQYAKVNEDLMAIDGAVAITSGGHSTLGVKALLLEGTPEQRARYLPRLASGELIAAFALSEAGAGSDAQSLRTTARRDGNGDWVLDGTKLWITNGALAGLFTVFARTPEVPRDDGRPSISCFLVEKSPGVVIGPEEDKLGITGSSTVPLTFEGVQVPAGNLVGTPGEGFRLALRILNGGRTGLAANCLGACRFLLAETARYTSQREQFGRPIASFELIQHKLGRMAQAVTALDAMVYLTTGMVDDGHPDVALESAACKVFGTEILWSVVNHAVQCAGGNGFTTDYPFERMLRDARVNMIFEGTNEILRVMIGGMGARAVARRLGDGVAPTTRLGRRLSGAEAPDPLPVPPALASDALALSMAVAELAQGTGAAVAAHGDALGERQLVLAALADQAIAAYGQAAVLTRATGVVEARGEQAAAAELLLARGACRRLARWGRESAARLRDNDDDLLLETARAVSAAGGLPG